MKKGSGYPLTAEEKRTILAWFAGGQSLQTIAHSLGRSTEAVSAYLHREGLDPRTNTVYSRPRDTFWTPERDAHVRARWQAGDSTPEIARALGVPRWKVKNRLHQLRLWGDPTRTEVLQAIRDRALALLQEKINPAEVARQVGVKASLIYKWRRQSVGKVAEKSVPYTAEEQERILALHAAGYSDTDIAREIGRSPGGVKAWRQDHGLPGNEHSPVLRAKISRLAAAQAREQDLPNLRRRSHDAFVTSHGLPAGLPLKAARVALELALNGPRTRGELLAALDLSGEQALAVNPSPLGRANSATGLLVRLGLIYVERLPRQRGDRFRYWPTAELLDRVARAARERTHEDSDHA